MKRQLGSSAFLGFTLAVIGSACYGLNPLFALPLYGMGMNPLSVLFYRYGLSTVLMLVWMLIRHEPFRLTGKELPLTLLMGVLFAGSSALLFFSYKFMDAGLASVILFTYPLFVALLSWIFCHEKMTWSTMVCIIVAFAGICMLDQSDGTGSMSLTGMLMAVGSGLSYAVYLIGVNRSVLKSMSTVKLSFYVMALGTLLFFLAGRCGMDIMPLPNWSAFGDAVGLAVFPTVISIVLVTRAIHIVGSTPASIIGALEPITALLVSLTVFGGTLTVMNIIGIVLVLGAVVLMVYSKRK